MSQRFTEGPYGALHLGDLGTAPERHLNCAWTAPVATSVQELQLPLGEPATEQVHGHTPCKLPAHLGSFVYTAQPAADYTYMVGIL